MLSGDLDGVYGRIYRFDFSSERTACQEAVPLRGTGNTEKIAVAGDQRAWFLGQVQDQINHTGRGNTDRTAGTGEQPDIFRKDALKPAAGDSHCVGAADFHQTDGTGLVGIFPDFLKEEGCVFRFSEITVIKHFLFPPEVPYFPELLFLTSVRWQIRHGP